MSDKTNVVNTAGASTAAVEEKATDIQATAAARADAVAQKKLADLAYAENYRQKLREEKAQRVSPNRRKAEQERLETKERERRERRERMEQMLQTEKAAVAERNAQSDAVLTVVAEAEKEKAQREEAQASAPQAQPDVTAEPRAAEEKAAAERAAEEKAAAEARAAEEKAAAERAAEEKAVAEARAAEEKAAAEARAAEEKAAAEARAAEEARIAEEHAAEEAARKEAAAQVQQIVARVEAERAAERAAAEARAAEEKAAAERAAAEARAAEKKAAAERAAEEKAAAEARAAEEKAAAEAKQAERISKQEAIRTEAAAMAAQHVQAAKDEAARRREEKTPSATKPAALRSSGGASTGADDLLAERRRARQHAMERVRSEHMANRMGHLSYEEKGYAPEVQPQEMAPYEAQDTALSVAEPVSAALSAKDRARRLAYEKREGRLVKRDQRMVEKNRKLQQEQGATEQTAPMSSAPLYAAPVAEAYPYDSLADAPYTDEAELRSVRNAVREARQAEREAKRAMKEAERADASVRDYDAERRSVAPAVVRELPTETAPATLDTLDAEAIAKEEKHIKRQSRRANKLVRGVIVVKKENNKDKKTVERLLTKETRRKEQSEAVVGKKVAAAERTLAKAEKKERRAQSRVERVQREANKLTQKQTAMEAKHARRLAKHPGLARKLKAKEERLSKDILKAYRQVDKAARKEEKKAQKVLVAQQQLDRVLGKQAKVERKTDRRIERVRRAEAQVDRRIESYDNKANRRLSKNELATDRAAARENVGIYKGEIPRSLHSVSSRQLAYEKRRLKKGELTRIEAERTLDTKTRKTGAVLKAERRLAAAEKEYAVLGKEAAKRQKKVDRLSARLERMETQDALLLETNAALAPKLLAKERKLTRKLTRAQKKVTSAERRQDAFERKKVRPAMAVLEGAQKKQDAEYRAQSKRLLRAKRRSDRDAYRTSLKKTERKNMEEKRREIKEKSALDAAELAAITAPRVHDTRKVRVLKRQVKQARKQETDAELRAARSRRTVDKAAAQNELKNHENERIIEKNPKAYRHIVKQAEKNRRRLEDMERAADRDERRLSRASRRSEKAVLKLERAMGKRTNDNAAIAEHYEKIVEQPHVKEDTTLSRKTRREQKREAARARKEEREYERLMAELRRESEAPVAEETVAVEEKEAPRRGRREAQPVSESVVAETATESKETPVSTRESKRSRREMQSSLHTLDRLYEERARLKEKTVRQPEHIGTAVRLVNLQKEICDEHFFLLRKSDIRTDSGALALAEQATEELRCYNRYITELNRKSGRYYSFAKLTGAYRILEGKNPAPIAFVTYKATKAEHVEREETDASCIAAEPVTETPTSYAYGQASTPRQAMSKREFSAYVNGLLKTNVDIEKKKKSLRKQQKQQKHHALMRSQTEILSLQKAVIDNYIRIFTVAYEEGRGRQVRSLIGNATKRIREYNREAKQLEALDHSRHVRIDAAIPKQILSGENYQEIPSLVCMMPGGGKLEGTGAWGASLSETDRALVESRFNYRISGVTRSLKDDRYDYVLFPTQAKRTNRSKRRLLAKLKADRKLALAAEAWDNQRYDALMSFEPSQTGRAARRVNHRELAALRQKVNRLLVQRDDINRELLSLYAMAENGTAMHVTEQYEDGTTGHTKKMRDKDAPQTVHERGYLTRRGRQLYSPDEEFARAYEKEKNRQYSKGMKRMAEVRKLNLPSTDWDVQALFSLHNRRVDLITTAETAEAKIRIYGYKGKAAAAVQKERREAYKELKRVEREIKKHMTRARETSRRRPKPFWR